MSLFDAKINCDTQFIYKKYRDDISMLISYIEVYEHDLPSQVTAEMAELFQTISLCEIDESFPNNSELSTLLDNTAWKITQSLKKYCICLFIRKIQEYKKTFHKYKYKGVSIDEQNFYQVAHEAEKRLCKTFAEKLRRCYKGKTILTLKELSIREQVLYMVSKFKISLKPSFRLLKKDSFLPTDRLVFTEISNIDFSDTYNDAKDLLEKYEKVFPNVVQKGRNKSLAMSIFSAVTTWIIPIVLIIPVVLKIIDAIKAFIYK